VTWAEERDPPETAEDEESSELSEEVPKEVSGEGGTPLGSTDEHSDAPGETGTGQRRGET
jgi:hypothetical protein